MSYWLVELELKRIQTYLFQVPRLRAMIGANALVGETLRGLWCGDKGFTSHPSSLPYLAQENGSEWPVEAKIPEPTPFLQKEDKLDHEGHWQDNAAMVAKRTGVLSRDGGHFEAVFPAAEMASKFLEEANDLISRALPGARLETRLFPLDKSPTGFTKKNSTNSIQTIATQAVFDLPQGLPCQLSGSEIAVDVVSAGNENWNVGPSAKAAWQRGLDFDSGKTRDVLGLLRPELLKAVGLSAEDRFPADFNELATQGYVAVVHVDGNSLGQRFKDISKAHTKADFFTQWAYKEAFFQTVRCGMRRAVLAAIEDVFKERHNRMGKVPLRLLMLGGDDLLLVCGAPYALPFVKQLARRLAEETKELPAADGKTGPLDIGAGVAIVQDSFPFHRAHQLAEQLASSAKRIKSLGSAVDWITTSESWYGDIGETRRRSAVIDNRVILSRKPYPIKKSDKNPGLESLIQDAQELREDQSVARGQLRRLTESLPQGELTAHFVAQTLPHGTRVPLERLGYLDKEHNPWSMAGRLCTTRLLDLFELYELSRLQRMEEGETD